MEEKKEETLGEKIGAALTNPGLIAMCFAQAEKDNIYLGIEIAALRNAYYYKALLAFLKGDDEQQGSMYFCNLKPLYDKYGYEKVNKVILEIDKEESKTNE